MAAKEHSIRKALTFAIKSVGVAGAVLAMFAVYHQVVESRREFRLWIMGEQGRLAAEQRSLLSERADREAVLHAENLRIEQLKYAEEIRLAAQRVAEAQARADAESAEARARQHSLEMEREKIAEQQRRESVAAKAREEAAREEEWRRRSSEIQEAILDVADPSKDGTRPLVKLWNGLQTTPFDPESVGRALRSRIMIAKSASEIELCLAVMEDVYPKTDLLRDLIVINKDARFRLERLIEVWLSSLPPEWFTGPKWWLVRKRHRTALLLEAYVPGADIQFAAAFINTLHDDRRMPVLGLTTSTTAIDSTISKIDLMTQVLDRTAQAIKSNIVYDLQHAHGVDGQLALNKQHLTYDLSATYLPWIKWPAGRLSADLADAYVFGSDFGDVELDPSTMESLKRALVLDVDVGDPVTRQVRFVTVSERPEGIRPPLSQLRVNTTVPTTRGKQ